MSSTTSPNDLRPGEAVASPTLQSWIASGEAPRVLDVRTPAEFESAHIPGAYNVPLDTLREHRDELARHIDDAVVLVCRSGNRAAQAQQALAAAGLSQLHLLEGGMLRWESDSAPVNRGQQRWDLERQVRLVAGGIVVLSGLASIAAPKARWIGTAVGGGLVGAALTNTCAMGMALSKLPYNRGVDACDLDTILSQLADASSTAR